LAFLPKEPILFLLPFHSCGSVLDWQLAFVDGGSHKTGSSKSLQCRDSIVTAEMIHLILDCPFRSFIVIDIIHSSLFIQAAVHVHSGLFPPALHRRPSRNLNSVQLMFLLPRHSFSSIVLVHFLLSIQFRAF
jgi:hypothetical protein